MLKVHRRINLKLAHKGFTIIEIMLVMVIISILALFATPMVLNMIRYFQRMELQNTMIMQANSTMNQISTFLRRATPSSINICANGNCPCSPGACVVTTGLPTTSRIEFGLPTGTTTYAIYFQNNAINWETDYNNNNGVLSSTAQVVLANNVTNLSFAGTPTAVSVSLKMSASIDGSTDTTKQVTFSLPNQTIAVLGQ